MLDTPAVLAKVLGPVTATAARWAEVLHVPLNQEARILQALAALSQAPVWQAPAARSDPVPVVLVGGMASNPVVQRPMRTWLERSGHQVVAAPVRWGLDCGERTTRAVLRTMEELVEASGRPVALIAHSRGGQYARVAAVRRPDLTAGLVTLGSPLVAMFSVHRILQAQCVALGLAGTLGVPGLFSAGCLWGECCRTLRSQLTGAFPTSVPFVSVYSPTDEVVRWTSTLDPAAQHVAVEASHGGLLVSTDVFQVLDRVLPRWPAPAADTPTGFALAA